MGVSESELLQRYRTDLVYLGVMLGFCAVSLFPVAVFRVLGRIPSWLLREDGVYESGAALACLAASLLFGWAWLKIRPARPLPLPLLRPRRNVFTLLFALAVLFLFLEEISWGQRLLGIETPAFVRGINFQNEINIHNLTVIKVGGKTAAHYAMRVLRFYMLFVPLIVAAFACLRHLVRKFDIPVPSVQIALVAWLIRWLNDLAYDQIYADTYVADVHHIGEVFEGNMEVLLLVLAVEFVLRRREAGCSA